MIESVINKNLSNKTTLINNSYNAAATNCVMYFLLNEIINDELYRKWFANFANAFQISVQLAQQGGNEKIR